MQSSNTKRIFDNILKVGNQTFLKSNNKSDSKLCIANILLTIIAPLGENH